MFSTPEELKNSGEIGVRLTVQTEETLTRMPLPVGAQRPRRPSCSPRQRFGQRQLCVGQPLLDEGDIPRIDPGSDRHALQTRQTRTVDDRRHPFEG